MRNIPALPLALAESSCPPANNFVSTASSNEVAAKESDSSHRPGSIVSAFLCCRKWGLMTQQRGLELAVKDGAALIANFIRNLQASGQSKVASAGDPQRLGVDEGEGAQTELDSSNM